MKWRGGSKRVSREQSIIKTGILAIVPAKYGPKLQVSLCVSLGQLWLDLRFSFGDLVEVSSFHVTS
jgi:hypothetical protein